MKTFRLRNEDIVRSWFLIDAADQPVGRLACKIVKILSGKNKTQWSHDVDCGDYVVVVNCEKVKLSGKKATVKKYHHHSLYPGGLRTTTYEHMLEKHPERILQHAVKGMLSKNKLQDRQLNRLKVYKGTEHEHTAQNPQKLTA